MPELITSNRENLRNAVVLRNPTRFPVMLYKGLNMAFEEEWWKKRRRKEPAPPFKVFCKGHLTYPDYPVLMHAIEVRDEQQVRGVIMKMSRGGWRDYLKSLRTTDRRASCHYLAKEGGRKPRSVAYSCEAPLIDGHGIKKFSGKDKCNLLADHFERRLGKDAEECPMELNPLGGEQQNQSHRRRNHAGDRPSHCGTRQKKRGIFEKIHLIEVERAIGSMQKKKAPGPDGYAADIYQHLHCMWGPMLSLFNQILQTGRVPRQMLKLLIVPLDKPRKDQELCTSKRPISLICVLSKILESIGLRRLQRRLRCVLDGRQYAHRNYRSTGTHLTEFYDFVKEARRTGYSVFVGAVDVSSAFDAVPHSRLLKTVSQMGIDPFLYLYLSNWLPKRIFAVRLTVPRGRFFSPWRKIKRGVPQGGVLPPFLWLLHISALMEQVDATGNNVSALLDRVARCSLLYAGDVLSALAHMDAEVVTQAAGESATAHGEGLKELGQKTATDKSENFLRPRLTKSWSLFRRFPNAPTASSKIRAKRKAR